jgi:hypothetical protein
MGMWRVLLAITSLDPASVYREDETICNERTRQSATRDG